MNDLTPTTLIKFESDKTKPPTATNPVEKWFKSDKKSRTLAIKAKCSECMGCTVDHREVGFIESIRACSSSGCPLHQVRPYRA